MKHICRIGMDTSKHVFQLHGVNASEDPVVRKKLRRKDMVAFFEKLAPTVIAIEACGGSHHWARLLSSLGHEVKLIRTSVGQTVRQARQERRGGRRSALRGDEPTCRLAPPGLRRSNLPLAISSAAIHIPSI